MNPELSVDQPEAVRGDDLIEGRRTASILRLIVPTVPRTGEAAVNDPPFTQRSALVTTHIARGKNPVLVTNQGDPMVPNL